MNNIAQLLVDLDKARQTLAEIERRLVEANNEFMEALKEGEK